MKIIGLMSGTSLDGLDAALLDIEEGREPYPLDWQLLAFRSRPFTPAEREVVRAAIESGGARELARLHVQIGEWQADLVLRLLEETGTAPAEVAALGSHGLTVWHQPPEEGERGFTLQLGCPATLAERTGIGVASDFRARDMAAGGHGAPLVPWADRCLFASQGGPRVLQNLGGMANVTWLPGPGDPAPILGFDTGPGVALIDLAAEWATAGEWSFDESGALAARGRVHEGVLASLLEDPFFQAPPPRSTGREHFSAAFVQRVVAAVEQELGERLRRGVRGRGWEDVLATLTAFTVRSIGEAYRRWVFPRGGDEVFLFGGGARNPVLVEGLRRELAPLRLRSGEELGMDPDAREAAAFAVLAWAYLNGRPANAPDATGSKGPRILGSWTPGRKAEWP